MSSLTKIKLVLAGTGALLFGAGVRTNLGWLRVAGIVLVFVAWILRFAGKPDDESTAPVE